MENFSNKFINFAHKGSDSFNATKTIEEELIKNDFTLLKEKEQWSLDYNKRYYIKKNNSAIVAFTTGRMLDDDSSFRLIASHTDSPSIKIKPNPVINKSGYSKLNIECYGGAILNTWFDRPLGISGRVFTKSSNSFLPDEHIIRIDKPMLYIPNISIHQNRDVNNGVALNKQEDILPIIATTADKDLDDAFVSRLISENLNINKDNILDYELYLFELEKGRLFGSHSEFISSARIDNLASVFCSLEALIESNITSHINLITCFDNEEVGSQTKQGAGSSFLQIVLERIIYGLGCNKEKYLRVLSNSFMISADGAHATHPNKPNLSDPTNELYINSGVAIKYNSNFSYTTDAYSASVIKSIAMDNSIPLQSFLNRSDVRGGSTIGPISTTHLPINSLDLGIPMFAMHSIREVCGIKDLYNLKKILLNFLNY